MAYLLCRNCSGYFKLEANESPHDYESCSCGGQLRYLKSIKSFCEDLKADMVEVDNSVILHDRLKGFKDRIQTETTYSDDYDDYYSEDDDYFEYEYSETYEEVVEELGYHSNDIQFNVSAINDLFEVPEEPEYTPVPDIFPGNQIAAPNVVYESEVHSDYLDNYIHNDSILLSYKNYFENHVITLLGFSILPLEYYYLFGSLPSMVMASFIVAAPLILYYLPKTSEISSHSDVKKICALWLLYYVTFGIILLSWLIFTQRQFDVLYII